METVIARGAVARPFEEVLALLGYQPGDWLQPFLRIAAQFADAEGAALAERLGRAVPLPAGERQVSIATRPSRQPLGVGEVSVAFRWRAEGYRTLFAGLDGTFQIRAGAGGRTEILVEARACPQPSMADPVGIWVTRRTAGSAGALLLEHLRSAMEERARLPVALEDSYTE